MRIDNKKEELNFKEIMEAVKIINDGGRAIMALQINYKNLEEKVNREIRNREEDTGEVKYNYLARFKDIKDTLGGLFKKIDGINALVIKLFVSLFSLVFASTVFLVLNSIFKWLI